MIDNTLLWDYKKMAKEISKQSLTVFEKIKHSDENGNEYWGHVSLPKYWNTPISETFLLLLKKRRKPA